MGAIIPGTVPRIIATLFFADVRVVSENGRGLYTRSGRRIAKLPISLPPSLPSLPPSPSPSLPVSLPASVPPALIAPFSPRSFALPSASGRGLTSLRRFTMGRRRGVKITAAPITPASVGF